MADKISVDLPGVTDPDLLFHYRLGVFHAVWSTIDIMTDVAIWKLMKVPPQEAHMITWGMMYGQKAKLLATLLKRSDHKNKQALMTAINVARGEAKRDILAHGYMLEGADAVAFLEKPRSTDFKARLHQFTREEFRLHVDKIIGAANALQAALGVSNDEVDGFTAAALSIDNKA